MKFIIISYPPTFYTRIIPMEKVWEINTFIDQEGEDEGSRCLKVHIVLENEIIYTTFCGEPGHFWEHWDNDEELQLDCFEIEKLSVRDKENMKYADSLFKLKG